LNLNEVAVLGKDIHALGVFTEPQDHRLVRLPRLGSYEGPGAYQLLLDGLLLSGSLPEKRAIPTLAARERWRIS